MNLEVMSAFARMLLSYYNLIGLLFKFNSSVLPDVALPKSFQVMIEGT